MRGLHLAGIQTWWDSHRSDPINETELPENPHLVCHASLPYGADAEGTLWEETLSGVCLDTLGQWDECLLWVRQTGVFPSCENWPAFYALRGEDGELNSVDWVPGHLFQWGERECLGKYLTIVLNNFWDAVVLPVIDGQTETIRLATSHDEFVDLWSSTRSDSAPVSTRQ